MNNDSFDYDERKFNILEMNIYIIQVNDIDSTYEKSYTLIDK